MSARREFLLQAIVGALGGQTLTVPQKLNPGACLKITGHGALEETPCLSDCREGESRCPACGQCQLPLPLIEEPTEWGEDEQDAQQMFAYLATWIKARVCSKCKSVYVP